MQFVPGRAHLSCGTRFDAETLGADDTRRYLEELLEAHFGVATELRIEWDETQPKTPARDAPATMSELEVRAADARRTEKRQEALRRPAVKALTEVLDARVTKVRVIDDS